MVALTSFLAGGIVHAALRDKDYVHATVLTVMVVVMWIAQRLDRSYGYGE